MLFQARLWIAVSVGDVSDFECAKIFGNFRTGDLHTGNCQAVRLDEVSIREAQKSNACECQDKSIRPSRDRPFPHELLEKNATSEGVSRRDDGEKNQDANLFCEGHTREEILRLNESCISNPKSEIPDWTGPRSVPGRLPVQLEISDFGFEMQDSSNFKILSRSVPQPERPFLRSIHRALCEPFERCTEQYQMVLFPHCVVGRASEIDEYLLARAKIGEQISYTLGRDLFIVNARNHQCWDLRFPHHRCSPAPVRHLGRASYAAAPRGADRIGFKHLRPDGLQGFRLILRGTTHLPVPVRDEFVARFRVHGCAFGRKRGGRRGGSHPVVCGRQQYQLLNLVRMLRGIASGAWPAERPRNQTYAVYMAQSPYIIDRGADVVPVGRDRRHLPRIARSARCSDEARNEGRLLLPGEITGIVHRGRPCGAAVTRSVHREHVETRTSQISHPAVIPRWDVERHFRRRARTMYEKNYSIRESRAPQNRSGLCFLSDIDLRRLAGDGRYSGLHTNKVVDREQLLAVFSQRDPDTAEHHQCDKLHNLVSFHVDSCSVRFIDV